MPIGRRLGETPATWTSSLLSLVGVWRAFLRESTLDTSVGQTLKSQKKSKYFRTVLYTLLGGGNDNEYLVSSRCGITPRLNYLPGMKIDGGLGVDSGFDGIMDKSREPRRNWYDGLWVPETSHDPFTMLPLMAEATENVELGTSIVVGFARNPMDLAYSANDIQLISKGRFTLGLGSQLKAHITRRFSMEWSKPAARMREMILATKAIWNSWNTGEKLDFRGDFYEHTLMTPFFHPGENPYGAPLALAEVGPLMTEVAGETCDVFLAHGFTTEKYLREETIPALERGAERGEAFLTSKSPVRCSLLQAITKKSSKKRNKERVNRLPFTVQLRHIEVFWNATAGGKCKQNSTLSPKRASGLKWEVSLTMRSSTPSPWLESLSKLLMA